MELLLHIKPVFLLNYSAPLINVSAQCLNCHFRFVLNTRCTQWFSLHIYILLFIHYISTKCMQNMKPLLSALINQ